MANPLVYRFKIFPFLKENILPVYRTALTTQGNFLMTFSDEEREMIDEYNKLFNYHLIITNTLDLRNFHSFFELMEKHVKFLESAFKKFNINVSEKAEILSHFHEENNKRLVNYFLV